MIQSLLVRSPVAIGERQDMAEIEFPFGKTLKPAEWGTKAFVYAIDNNAFAITQEKNPNLEEKSDRRFEAKVTVKDDDINVALPVDFARFYLYKRKATMLVISDAEKLAIVVQSEGD